MEIILKMGDGSPRVTLTTFEHPKYVWTKDPKYEDYTRRHNLRRDHLDLVYLKAEVSYKLDGGESNIFAIVPYLDFLDNHREELRLRRDMKRRDKTFDVRDVPSFYYLYTDSCSMAVYNYYTKLSPIVRHALHQKVWLGRSYGETLSNLTKDASESKNTGSSYRRIVSIAKHMHYNNELPDYNLLGILLDMLERADAGAVTDFFKINCDTLKLLMAHHVDNVKTTVSYPHRLKRKFSFLAKAALLEEIDKIGPNYNLHGYDSEFEWILDTKNLRREYYRKIDADPVNFEVDQSLEEFRNRIRKRLSHEMVLKLLKEFKGISRVLTTKAYYYSDSAVLKQKLVGVFGPSFEQNLKREMEVRNLLTGEQMGVFGVRETKTAIRKYLRQAGIYDRSDQPQKENTLKDSAEKFGKDLTMRMEDQFRRLHLPVEQMLTPVLHLNYTGRLRNSRQSSLMYYIFLTR